VVEYCGAAGLGIVEKGVEPTLRVAVPQTKGILMKLKIVVCAIWLKSLFLQFFDVLQRSFKSLSFARSILPFATG